MINSIFILYFVAPEAKVEEVVAKVEELKVEGMWFFFSFLFITRISQKFSVAFFIPVILVFAKVSLDNDQILLPTYIVENVEIH